MGVNLRRSVVAGLLLPLLCVGGARAQTGTIMGRVLEQDTGNPVAGARVQARDAAGTVRASVLSAQDGGYRIPGLRPGAYTLMVASVGYEDAQVQVRLGEGMATVTADIRLATRAFELNPLVVTASKRQQKALDAPATVEVVSEREIDARPVLTPVDHLRSVAGVDVITAGLQSTNVVLRGFNNIFSGALHVLTDYRNASIPSLRVNLLHFIPANDEDIDRMEVVLGPGSALYGPNTANGVLAIFTKSPLDQQGTSVEFAGGERNVLNGSFRTAGKLSDNFGVKLSGQYLSGDEWKYLDPVEQAAKFQALNDPTQFRAELPLGVNGQPLTESEIQQRIKNIANRDFQIERWSLDGRADWQATPELNAVFQAGITNAVSGIELTGIGAAQARSWLNGYYQARARFRGWFAQAYLNTSDAGDTYLLRTGAPIVDRSRVFTAQLQHSASIGSRQNFTYGVDYIRTMPNTEGTINGINENHDNFTEFGGYLQSTTGLSDHFDLVLAGRYDKHSELDHSVFSPRAGLVFKPSQNQSFRITYNRAFSTPTALNLFLDIDGGRAPDPLGSLGYRIRAQGPGKDGFSFTSSTGALLGMRSPFAAALGKTPSTLLPADAGSLYALQLAAVVQGALAKGSPLPPQILQFLAQAAPDVGANIGISTLDPVTHAVTPLQNSLIPDVPGIKESTSSVFEAGYRGIIGERLLVNADVWHDQEKNFTSPLIPQTPLLMLTPTELVPYLVPGLTQAFMGLGLPADQAQAQATDLATQLAAVPGAVVSSDQVDAAGADLLVTYRNFGKVNLWGADLSLTAILSDQWSISGSASFTNKDFFNLQLGGQPQPIALNAPKNKATASVDYRNNDVGFNGEVRVRYTDGFPANSADYVGTACVGGTGQCVDPYTLADLTLDYKLPHLGGASLQMAVTNVFGTKYRSFVGVPSIGRLTLLRLRYNF